MGAKELSYPFTDYRRTGGGAEQHNGTEGELTLGARWTLHFKGRLRNQPAMAASRGMTCRHLHSPPAAAGSASSTTRRANPSASSPSQRRMPKRSRLTSRACASSTPLPMRR